MLTTIALPGHSIVLEIDGVCGRVSSTLHEIEEADEYNTSVDVLESLILAHAMAGVDVKTPAYIEGIETVVNTLENKFLS